jgi:hypothetical protein
VRPYLVTILPPKRKTSLIDLYEMMSDPVGREMPTETVNLRLTKIKSNNTTKTPSRKLPLPMLKSTHFS